MVCDSEFFWVDSFIVDGEEWLFIDDSVMIEGVVGFECDILLFLNGQDYMICKCVQCFIKMKLQFMGVKMFDDVSKVCEVQIVMMNLYIG